MAAVARNEWALHRAEAVEVAETVRGQEALAAAVAEARGSAMGGTAGVASVATTEAAEMEVVVTVLVVVGPVVAAA